MNSERGLNVAIYAPVTPGTCGGVAQFVACLIGSLGKLDDGCETYTILVESQDELDWLKNYSGPNQRFVLITPLCPGPVASQKGHPTFPGMLKRALGPLLPAARYVQRLLNVPVALPPPRAWPEVPLSDGFYESLGCNVIHMPTQKFILCGLPTIYNPHDLQHLHYPQFFPPTAMAWRETIYPAGCHFAQTVVVGSQWVKDDVVRRYRVDPGKVQVIPEGAPTELYPEPSEDFIATVKQQYGLKQPFALYPAVTWPHKNHIRLLEALAFLRDTRGLEIQLVCTGSRCDEFWPSIEKRLGELDLGSQVRFLGFVPEEDLRALYQLSQFLVEPSLFEACSLPIFEAWSEGVPVACSDRTALPEQVLEGALQFDPASIESIAAAMEKLATDSEVRHKLRECGFRRLKDFDWQRTAKAYRAVYRHAAGRVLTEEDRWLLSWNWMKEPRRNMETPL